MSDVILLKEHSLKEQINVNRKALRIFCFLKGDPKYLYFLMAKLPQQNIRLRKVKRNFFQAAKNKQQTILGFISTFNLHFTFVFVLLTLILRSYFETTIIAQSLLTVYCCVTQTLAPVTDQFCLKFNVRPIYSGQTVKHFELGPMAFKSHNFFQIFNCTVTIFT